MSIQTKTTLKGYFTTGAKPTQSQFGDLIDTQFIDLVDPTSALVVVDSSGSGKNWQYRATGNDSLQNVPFRWNADTDVPVNFCTPNDGCSLAVSTDSGGSLTATGNPPFNMYFGIRSQATSLGFICLGDGAGVDHTIALGSDGVGSEWNLIQCGQFDFIGASDATNGFYFNFATANSSGGFIFSDPTGPTTYWTCFHNAANSSFTLYNNGGSATAFTIDPTNLFNIVGNLQIGTGAPFGVAQVNSTASTVGGIVADFNTLLGHLRSMGVMS